MSEVYQREGSPFWYYDIIDPVTQKRKRKSTKKKLKKEAQDVARKALKEGEDRVSRGYTRETTVGKALDRYVEIMAAMGSKWDVGQIARKITGQGDSNKGRFRIDPNTLLHAVTTRTVNDIKTKRIAEGNAPGTVNLELKVLRRSISIAREEGCRTAPDEVLKFSYFKTEEKLRYLSEIEEVRLLRELDPARPLRWKDRFGNEGHHTKVSEVVKRQMQDIHDLVIFLLDTGCRYNELASVSWDCIDTVDWKWVNIYRTKVDKSGQLAMTDRVREILKRRWEARPNNPFVFAGYGPDIGPRGKSTKAIRKAIGRANLNTPTLVEAYGRVTVHTFRDTAATRWRQNGAELDEIRILLGHSDIKQTMKYAHLNKKSVAVRASEILNRIHEKRASVA